MHLSIILPARNESACLGPLLLRLREQAPDAELILVDDGSTDDTSRIAREHGARVISHPYSLGNGAAVKSGALFFTGLGYYAYTFATAHKFTNMSALLFTAAVVVFMMGLISEQITALSYREGDR